MAQAGYWTTNLIDASLSAGDTELTFPVSSRQVEGGRDWASRKFPFRNGQSDEDTGARPRALTYTVPLFRDVEEEHYPNTMFDLVEFIESDEVKGRATLTDPEFGSLPVRLTGYSWNTESVRRDGGELRLTFETLGDENFTIITVEGSGDGAAADASVEAAAVDDALAESGKKPTDTALTLKDAQVALSELERLELGLSASFSANIGLSLGVNITVPQVPALATFTTTVKSTSGFGAQTVADNEVRLFTAMVDRFQKMVERGDLRSVDEIAAETDVLMARVAAVRNDPTLNTDSEKGWAVYESTAQLMGAIQRVAMRAFQDVPLVLDYVLTRELSAFEVAVLLFSDPTRVQDVIDLNPSVSPDFLPKGTTLIVPLE